MLSEAGGIAMFRNNDGSVVGSPAIVFPAVLELDREVQEKCLFHLQRSSARTVFCQQVPNCPPPLESHWLAALSSVFYSGFVCYGIPD